jgi:hypothetical protein
MPLFNPPSSATAAIDVRKAGTLIGTRPAINLIDGANQTITVADNSGSNRVDVTVAETIGGGTGQLCIVNRAANQSITSGGSPTLVSWDSEREDVPGWFTLGTPDRITVTATGVYVVNFQGCWSSSPAASFTAGNIYYCHVERLRVADGIQEILGACQALDPKDATSMTVAWVGTLLTGDAVRVKVYQATGSTQSFGGKNRVSGNPIADSSNAELGVARII